MASKKCTKKITISGKKLAFKDVRVFTVDPDGSVRRIRSRSDIPADPSGSVNVFWVPKDEHSTAPRDLSDMEGFRQGSVASGSPGTGRALTGQGGVGHLRDPLGEFSALARSFRAGDSAYESAGTRGKRLRRTASALASQRDLDITSLVSDLRRNDGVRTPAVVLAVEAAFTGHPQAYEALRAALARPDEPGLALQYAMEAHGRIPSAVRRAAGDAAVALFTEESALRFDKRRTRTVTGEDGEANGFTFADVVRLTHARPSDSRQATLFAFLTGNLASGDALDETLPVLSAVRRLRAASPAERSEALSEAQAWAHRVFAGEIPASVLPEGTLARGIVAGGVDVALQFAPWEDATLEQFLEEEAAARVMEKQTLEAFAPLRTAANALRRARRKASWERGNKQNPELQQRRQAKLESLSAISGAVDYAENGVKFAKAHRVSASHLVQETKRSLESARRSRVAEAALPTMSDRMLLSRLGDISAPEVSAEAKQYAKGRVREAFVRPDGNASLGDVIRAAKAVSELEGSSGRGRDSFPFGDPWFASPSEWDAVVDEAVGSKAAAKLDPLKGQRVLVLVDTSGSMWSEVSTRKGSRPGETYSGLRRDEVAAFVAGTIASSSAAEVDVVVYDTDGELVPLDPSMGPMEATREIASKSLGGGTDTLTVTDKFWDGHDIVVTLTDEQVAWGSSRHGGDRLDAGSPFTRVPRSVQMVTCNLAGEQVADRPETDNWVSVSGMSDSLFDEIAAAAQRARLAAGGVDSAAAAPAQL